MIGARCQIHGADFDGIVVGKTQYVGDQDRYAVRFFANGTPQERWFTAGEISFSGTEANVVALSARRAA